MTRSPSEAFWATVCDFRDVVIVLWSISLVFFLISAALLVTDATDQNAILMLNLIILSVPLVVSVIVLAKCKGQ